MNAIQKQISKIINSLIIALSAGIGGSILLGIVFIIVFVSSNGGTPSTGGIITIALSSLAFLGVLIYAYCLYLIGIKGFGKHLDDVGKSATNLMFWGNLLPICVAFLGCWFIVIAPVFGLLFIVCGALASLVLLLMGSFKLPKSSSLNAEGVAGAKTFKTAIILNAASSLLSVIYCFIMMPLMIDLANQGADLIQSSLGCSSIFAGAMWTLIAVCGSVLSILSIIFMFLGLAKIRRSFAS